MVLVDNVWEINIPDKYSYLTDQRKTAITVAPGVEPHYVLQIQEKGNEDFSVNYRGKLSVAVTKSLQATIELGQSFCDEEIRDKLNHVASMMSFGREVQWLVYEDNCAVALISLGFIEDCYTWSAMILVESEKLYMATITSASDTLDDEILDSLCSIRKK